MSHPHLRGINGSSARRQGSRPGLLLAIVALASMQLAAAAHESTIDVLNPIYYPHSPTSRAMEQARSQGVDERLEEFLRLHTSMRYEDALQVVDQLIEIMPDSAVMHYNRACVLGRLHRTDEALDALERAIALGWRNDAQMRIDPDLQSIRWTGRYAALAQQLASAIQRERPSPVPLRTDSADAFARDLELLMPAFAATSSAHAATIALVEDGEHVWTKSFSSRAPSDGDDASPSLSPSLFLEGPVHLLAMLAIVDDWPHDAEPGPIRLAKLVRHTAEREMMDARRAEVVGYSTRGDSAAAKTHRQSRLASGRTMRITRVDDDIYDLLRLAIEHLSNDNFVRHCNDHSLPSLGMSASHLIAAGGRSAARTVKHPSPRVPATSDQSAPPAALHPDSWDGPRRLVLRTTIDDVARLLARVTDRSAQSGDVQSWARISDYLLRSCATRELAIGSSITIRRTPYGLRTDIYTTGGGTGCLMRWHVESRRGVAVIVAGDSPGARRAAERIAHHALGGLP